LETNSTAISYPISARILAGLSRALPIALGYVPIGFAYGVLAQKAAISAADTLLMSLIVYAGSSQLIAVALVAVGAPLASIVSTTFIVNLRHMLFSAALAPYLKRWSRPQLAGFAFELTDEVFAVHSARFANAPPDKVEVFSTNLAAQLAWLLGSLLGVVAGQLIQDVRPLGLDFALPAMFIALLVLQVKDRIALGVAILSGALSTAFLLAGMSQWHVIVATLCGATAGVGMEVWLKKRSS